MAAGNVSLIGMQINNNAALLGGGLFIAANLSQSVELASLALQNNYAMLGASPASNAFMAAKGCAASIPAAA